MLGLILISSVRAQARWAWERSLSGRACCTCTRAAGRVPASGPRVLAGDTESVFLVPSEMPGLLHGAPGSPFLGHASPPHRAWLPGEPFPPV